jgi:hypothetical protein
VRIWAGADDDDGNGEDGNGDNADGDDGNGDDGDGDLSVMVIIVPDALRQVGLLCLH